MERATLICPSQLGDFLNQCRDCFVFADSESDFQKKSGGEPVSQLLPTRAWSLVTFETFDQSDEETHLNNFLTIFEKNEIYWQFFDKILTMFDKFDHFWQGKAITATKTMTKIILGTLFTILTLASLSVMMKIMTEV